MALEIFTSIYTAAQQDALLGRVVKPVVIEDAASSYTFEVNDIVEINGVIFRCTSATSLMPHTLYTQNGKILYITINGEKCYMVKSQTLNTGWVKWFDIKDRFFVEKRLATKQNALTFDTMPKANSTNPVTSGGVKTALDAKANLEGYAESSASSFNLTENALNYTATDGSSLFVYAASDNILHTYRVLIDASTSNFAATIYFKASASASTAETLASLSITSETGMYYAEIAVKGNQAILTKPLELATVSTLS